MGGSTAASRAIEPQPVQPAAEKVRLWLVFEGTSGEHRAVGASTGAPRRGRRVAVRAPASVLQTRQLWLLARREPADVVLAVAAAPEELERPRLDLGRSALFYEVRAVPVSVEKTAP
jgi:hypothetical protein